MINLIPFNPEKLDFETKKITLNVYITLKRILYGFFLSSRYKPIICVGKIAKD
jgi:hypothetical protein